MAEAAIATARLRLRAWRESDVDPFMHALNRPEVTRWLGGLKPRSHYVDLYRRMADSQARDGHCFWIMEGAASGAILGFCGVRRTDHPRLPVHGYLELGWRLAASHWGRGYAKEAALASIDWCRAQRPDDHRLIAYTVPDNRASWGLMRAIGMERDAALDFDHPAYPIGHALSRHIVYALDRTV